MGDNCDTSAGIELRTNCFTAVWPYTGKEKKAAAKIMATAKHLKFSENARFSIEVGVCNRIYVPNSTHYASAQIKKC